MNDTVNMRLQGSQRFSHGLQTGCVTHQACGPVQVVRDSPACPTRRLGMAYPSEFLLDPPGRGGVQTLVDNLRQCEQLVVGQVADLSALKYCPTQLLEQWLFLPFQLAHGAHRAGKDLDNMEPVHGSRRFRQVLLNAADKRRQPAGEARGAGSRYPVADQPVARAAVCRSRAA